MRCRDDHHGRCSICGRRRRRGRRAPLPPLLFWICFAGAVPAVAGAAAAGARAAAAFSAGARGQLPTSYREFEPGQVERVYCLSDLHTDHPGNLEWLRQRMKAGPPPPPPPVKESGRGDTAPPRSPPPRPWTSKDLLVIAGDISHSLGVLEETLRCLRGPGCQVLFVAGNHEAWLEGRGRGRNGTHNEDRHRDGDGDDDGALNSLGKIERVYEACRKHGVMVGPCYVPAAEGGGGGGSRGSASSGLWIVPLQSWYDGTLGFAPELERGFESWPWVDFARCSWPPDRFPLDKSRIPAGLVDHWLETNLPLLDLASSKPPTAAAPDEGGGLPAVMTVSHFLPNFQSLPDWKDLDAGAFDLSWLDHGAGEMSAKFAKVAGSAKIDEQIRSLRRRGRRQIHVFGHSHRPKDFEHRGIRYVHNPLGKPRERELRLVSPDADFQLLWDAGSPDGEVPGPQILRYWDEVAGGKEALWERIERSRRSATATTAPSPSTTASGGAGRYSEDLPKRR